MNPIKLWLSYEKNLKKIDVAIKQGKVKRQLKKYEKNINGIPLVVDPCKQCKVYIENNGYDTSFTDFCGVYMKGKCEECCWFYDSKFEVEV